MTPAKNFSKNILTWEYTQYMENMLEKGDAQMKKQIFSMAFWQ